MPELVVLGVVAILVGGMVLLLRREHRPIPDEPPTLNTRSDDE